MKPRLHAYLTDDVNAQLDLLAARPGSSKSAIVNDALKTFFAKGASTGIDPVLRVRLDKVARHLERLERDQQVLLECLALFIRFELMITAPVPDSDQPAAKALGNERFNNFIEQVGRRLAAGRSLTREVLDQVSPQPRIGSTRDEGGASA